MFGIKSLSTKILLAIFLLIFALLPIHALISTWAISNFGHEILFKAWKEILLFFVGVPLAMWILFTDKVVYKKFSQSKINNIIAAFVAIVGVMAILRDNPAKVEIAGLVFDLRFLVMFVVGQILALKIAKNELRELVLRFVFWGGVVVVAFGALQVLLLPNDFLRHFGYQSSIIPPYFTVDNNPNIVRILSTLRGPNILGAYLVIWLPILALVSKRMWPVAVKTPNQNNSSNSLSTSRPESASRSSVYSRYASSRKADSGTTVATDNISNYSGQVSKFRIWVIIIWVASIITLFGSRSRSGWLGAAISVGVFILLSVSIVWRKRLIILGVAGAIVGLLVLIFAWNTSFVQTTLKHRDPTEQGSINSDDQRANSLIDSVKSFVSNPVGGGPGSVNLASTYGDKPVIVENYYLQIAQQYGALGLILFMMILVLVAIKLWEMRADDIAAALLAGFAGMAIVNMLNPAWGDETVSMLWWGLAGIAIYGYNISTKVKNRNGSR